VSPASRVARLGNVGHCVKLLRYFVERKRSVDVPLENQPNDLCALVIDDDSAARPPALCELAYNGLVDGGSKWRRGAAEFGSAGLVKVSERQEWCVAEEV
jgi:hypothetical protein